METQLMETNLGAARSWGAKDIMHGHQYSITKSLIIIIAFPG